LTIKDAKWNAKDRQVKGRSNTVTGEKVSWSKLSNADIPQIYEFRKQGMTQKAIASLYGVSRQAIGNIFLGRSWNSIKPKGEKTDVPKESFNRSTARHA